MIEIGSLNESEFDEIRERWDDVRSRTWIGQT
jgi:hypothetical protein